MISDARGIDDQQWFAPWLTQKPDRAVLTVFQRGASPPALLPSDALRAINAQFWDKSATEAITGILSLVALSLDDQRIFISYRRLETQPLAEQLFDALTHEGFDVFLDRFSIHPGLNFQQRLTQELADKSMLLLLESAWVHTSEWTNHEIQFAKRYQLGLLALQMPDRAEPLDSVDVDLRLPKLTPQDFKDPKPGETVNPEFATKGKEPPRYALWGPLVDDKLKEVVARAKTVHDQAVFRRRRFIRNNVEKTLRGAGLNPQPVRGDGLMIVNSTANYALWMTTRPPELADFHTTWAKVQPPAGAKGVIIGPTAALEPGRSAKLEWLKDRCNFACIDQDDVPEAARRMKDGKL
jgi:TIR domain